MGDLKKVNMILFSAMVSKSQFKTPVCFLPICDIPWGF